jgi:O-methyltransferase
MTSVDRQITLINVVRYIVLSNLPGSLVECGVWRGGSAMAMPMTLLQEGISNRDLFIFDTFEGMTDPASVDRLWSGDSARERLDRDIKRRGLD